MISLRVARGNFTTHFQLPSKSRASPLEIPMSTLAKDAAAFKSALARQDYTSWHSNPGPPKIPGDTAGEEPGEKKKKKKPKNSEYHLPSLPSPRSKCQSFRCRVFAAGGYWYWDQCQHAVGICSCTPEGLNVSP